VEKTKTPKPSAPKPSGADPIPTEPRTVGPSIQRDEWMMMDSSLIPAISRKELRLVTDSPRY